MADPDSPARNSGIPLGDDPIGPPPQHIIETEVKGNVSLYDPKQERVLVLNGTASDVWLLCDGEQTVTRIVELLVAAYGGNPATVRGDVETTIRQFIEEGFVPKP